MNKQWLLGLSLLSPFCFAQTLQLDTQGLHQFNIEAGSGDLQVKGEAGLSQIQVEDGSGDIEVNDARRFVLKRDGSGDVKLSNVRER